MTFSPAPLTALSAYWKKYGVSLGVVGDTAHALKGTSYHLGISQLTADAYSRILPRDKAGLSEAASAIDLGKLERTGFPGLRAFSIWLVAQCRTGQPGTEDIREVIYSPDGVAVKRWDNYAKRLYTGGDGTGHGDNSHRWHTHISYWRDSEKRDKVGVFRVYFEGEVPQGGSMSFKVVGPEVLDPNVRIFVAEEGAWYLPLENNPDRKLSGPIGLNNWPGGKYPVLPVRLNVGIGPRPTEDYGRLGYVVGTDPAFVLARNVRAERVTVAPPPADCAPLVEKAIFDATKAERERLALAEANRIKAL